MKVAKTGDAVLTVSIMDLILTYTETVHVMRTKQFEVLQFDCFVSNTYNFL